MFEIKKDVQVEDFDEDTRNFLLKAGLHLHDNMSNKLKRFTEEHGYQDLFLKESESIEEKEEK